MPRNSRLFHTVFIVICLGVLPSLILLGCFKKEKLRSSTSIVAYLPATTLGFGVLAMSEPKLRSYMNSQGYRNYWKGTEKSLQSNSALVGDWSTYIEAMRVLKLIPDSADADTLPYKELLFFVANEGDTMSTAAYYDIVPSMDGGELFKQLRAVIEKAKIAIEPFAGDNFKGFAFSPFSEGEPVNPVWKFYFELLGVKRCYVAASKGRLALGTSKAIVERGFAPARDEFRPFFEGTQYKSLYSSLDDLGSTAAFGAINFGEIEKVAPASVKSLVSFLDAVGVFRANFENDRMQTAIALAAGSDSGILQKYVANLPPPTGTLFTKLPTAAFVGLAVDSGAAASLVRAAGIAEQSPIPRAHLELLLAWLAKVKSVGLAALPPSAGQIVPSGLVVLETADAKSLASDFEQLPSKLGIPVPFVWSDTKLGELPARSADLQLGFKLQMVAKDNLLIFGNDDQSLLDVVNAAKEPPDLTGVPVLKSLLHPAGGPRAGMYIDYTILARVIESLSPGTGLPSGSMEQFQSMGKVAIVAGYNQAVVRLSMGQALEPASGGK